MHCSPLRCPYSNSEQPPQLCGAAGPEGSQQHGCSGTVTAREHGRQPPPTWVCAPALCFVPGPPKAPDGPHGTHGLYIHAHTGGEAAPGAAAPGSPAFSRPSASAAQSPPSSRPRSPAAIGQHRPGQSGERGRQLPLTSPGPGRADREPSVGAAEPRVPRPAPSRCAGGAGGDNDRGRPGSPCPRHRPPPPRRASPGPAAAALPPPAPHSPPAAPLPPLLGPPPLRPKQVPGEPAGRVPAAAAAAAAPHGRGGEKGRARGGRPGRGGAGGAGRGRLRHRLLTAPLRPGPLTRSPAVLP